MSDDGRATASVASFFLFAELNGDMALYAPAKDMLPEPTDARLDAARAREQMRFAPHMTILRQMERLDEAIALQREPWPAFYAFKSTLDAWAHDDPQFALDWNAALRERRHVAKGQYGLEYSWQAVSIMRTPYVKLMRRMGFFKDIRAPPSTLSAQRRAQRAPEPEPEADKAPAAPVAPEDDAEGSPA